ncbi:MAG: hypothetical protein EPO23_03225 [Xanthobacteraceae bacterium]|nr:MAG: hypothetical protein EPO23_03225 [Xanthobacteraceae bacterium]
MTFLAATLLLLASMEAARAEPVSAAIGLTVFLEGTFLAGWGGTIVSVGFSLALSAISMALAPRSAGSVNSPDVKFNEKQSTPLKRIIYGRARVGGALFFEECKPPYLYLGILIAYGEIDGIDGVYIGSNNVGLPYFTEGAEIIPQHQIKQAASSQIVGGVATTVPATFDYHDYLTVSLGYGKAAQAIDPILAADFTSVSADFRQRGIARAVLKCRWGDNQDDYTRVWGQVQRPAPFLDARGIKLYDPRNSRHDIADPATWTFSNNAILVIANYLMADYGGRVDPSRVDWERVAAEADWADGLFVAKSGEALRRYTIDGVINLGQRPSDVLASMGSAVGAVNRSCVIERGGRVWVAGRRPKPVVLTITDNLLCGGFKYRDARPKREKVNRVKTRFTASEREYQVVDGPTVDDDDLQALDGEILEATLSCPLTLDHRRVQRLADLYIGESRIGRALECRCDIRALALADDELIDGAVSVVSDLFPKINGTYAVSEMTIDLPFVDFKLQEYDASIETAWNAATDEQDFALSTVDVS